MNESAVDGPHVRVAEKFLRTGELPCEDPPVFGVGERRRFGAWVRSWWLVALVAVVLLVAAWVVLG